MRSLDRVLQIQVTGLEAKMFTQEMNHKSLIFRSSIPFEAGQELDLMMLMRHVPLHFRGRVQWVHEGSRGHTGQIDFQLPPEQEAQLLSYVEQRSR